MMAAALADGTTVLHNAAQEPEVVCLADLLRSMGAGIQGAGTDEIVIEGRRQLHGTEHHVIPDRIEAGTYLVAGALAGDGLEIEGVRPDHLEAVLRRLESVGVDVRRNDAGFSVSAAADLRAADIETSPYPGFPTDMQAQYMAMMTQARGTAVISETIFERRFMHVAELRRMGADIRIDGSTAVVVGPTSLAGAQVMATDLRASACLVLSALVAEGVTVVDRVYHLDRGYERMEEKLGRLGASVERIR
jgi:UDP-N-acetylglucosamine 1-carboxyvinyltransferase